MKKLRGKKPSPMKWEKKKFEKGYTDLSRSGFYYSTKWRKVRKFILDQEPLCRMCLEENIVKPAAVVDHIIPISESSSEELKFGEDNLCPLCFKHHQAKTNTDRGKGSALNRQRGKELMKELEN